MFEAGLLHCEFPMDELSLRFLDNNEFVLNTLKYVFE